MPLKSLTVFTDLMAKGRVFQSFGAAYVKERSPSVNSVASALVDQECLGLIKEITLGKSLINVNSVASVLAEQET